MRRAANWTGVQGLRGRRGRREDTRIQKFCYDQMTNCGEIPIVLAFARGRRDGGALSIRDVARVLAIESERSGASIRMPVSGYYLTQVDRLQTSVDRMGRLAGRLVGDAIGGRGEGHHAGARGDRA